MQDDHTNEDGAMFKAWMAAMGWDVHGGQTSCAAALGKHRNQIGRYMDGAALSTELRLAMTALSEGLRPWDEKTGGLPAVRVSPSI